MPRTLTPAEEMRLFAGLAAQPILATILTPIVHPLAFPTRYPPAGLGIALYFGVACVVITALCVFPTVLWLVRRRPMPLTLALCLGLMFSNLPVLYVMAGGGGGLRLHAFASVLGLVGSAAFWLIAIRGRDLSRDPVSA